MSTDENQKVIRLPIFNTDANADIEIILTGDGGGSITSTLKEPCPYCNQVECEFSCDSSQGAQPDDEGESEEDANQRIAYNHFLDGIESLVLAHAIAGIDVESPEYIQGIRSAIEGAANAFS